MLISYASLLTLWLFSFEDIGLQSQKIIAVVFAWEDSNRYARSVVWTVRVESSNFAKSRAKISKIAIPSMKICTEGPTLYTGSGKSRVSFSKDWSPIVKNEDVFNNFYRSLMGDLGKNSLMAWTSVQKKSFFF